MRHVTRRGITLPALGLPRPICIDSLGRVLLRSPYVQRSRAVGPIRPDVLASQIQFALPLSLFQVRTTGWRRLGNGGQHRDMPTRWLYLHNIGTEIGHNRRTIANSLVESMTRTPPAELVNIRIAPREH